MTFSCRCSSPISRCVLLRSTTQLHGLLQAVLDLLAADGLADEVADRVVVAVADDDRLRRRAFLGDGLGLGLAGSDLDLEAIEVAGGLAGLSVSISLKSLRTGCSTRTVRSTSLRFLMV